MVIYRNMTNEELRERIEMLERLQGLEGAETQAEVAEIKNRYCRPEMCLETDAHHEHDCPRLARENLWYPDGRNWVEWNPKFAKDKEIRKKIVDVLYSSERERECFAECAEGADFENDNWDNELSHAPGYTKIVAVVYA